MKKLNKKGFTLIELMVVIAILVIIMGIALPNITSSIERSKEKQKQNKLQLVTSSAELYFDRHRNTSVVTIETLINDGFLTEEEAKDIGCQGDASSKSCCIEIENYSFQSDPSKCTFTK